jgi:TM2 domain-containing membrane protein YozV
VKDDRTRGAPRLIQPARPPKSPAIAALLSLFLFGGAGQIWLGQWQKGTLLIVLCAALLWMTGGIWGWFLFGVGALDAHYVASKLRRGSAVREFEWFWSR